ncbi:hypothetical protein QOT17_016894 [Balamuthia mandrillaris]
MERRNVAEEVVRKRVWALLCHKEFGPCQPLLRQSYNVLRGRRRTVFQCSCGVLLPPSLKHQLGDWDESEEEDEEEGKDDDEGENEREDDEKERKRARVSANNEEGKAENPKTGERTFFEKRTLRRLCLVAVVSYIDNWIQQNLLHTMEVEEEDAEEEEEEDEEQEQEEEEQEEEQEEQEQEKQDEQQEQRNHEQVQEDEEKSLEDEWKEKEHIRNMVASYKRDMQRLNQKVETFLQQYFQKQQPEPEDKIPASSCSPPTWLHILPAELLDDITTLVPSSLNHSNNNIHPQHPPQPQLGGWRALYHDRALAKLLEAISRFIVYGYYGTASWCSWTANPCSASLPSSSTSTSSCWQLVDKNGGETQEEQKYIAAPAMMQALCFSSKEANSPCWKKLFVPSPIKQLG